MNAAFAISGLKADRLQDLFRSGQFNGSHGSGWNDGTVAHVAAGMNKAAPGVRQHPDAVPVKQLLLHSEGRGQGAQVIESGQLGARGTPQRCGSSQHEAYSRKAAGAPDAAYTLQISKPFPGKGKNLPDCGSQNFRSVIGNSPVLGADKLLIIREDDLQISLAGIENKFQSGGKPFTRACFAGSWLSGTSASRR